MKRYTKEGIVPFQLQMMEVDELDTMINASEGQKNRIVGGIEYNQYNKPVAYYFRQYGIDGSVSERP